MDRHREVGAQREKWGEEMEQKRAANERAEIKCARKSDAQEVFK